MVPVVYFDLQSMVENEKKVHFPKFQMRNQRLCVNQLSGVTPNR